MKKSYKTINSYTTIKAGKYIRNLLLQKKMIVIFALILTGFGAAITGVLFKASVQELEHWREIILQEFPAWIVLPLIGGTGGFLSAYLISKFSPTASGTGITHIMEYLRHKKVPMGLHVGLTKLIAGIIAIGSGFPLGPEGPSVQMGGSVAWQMAQWLKAPPSFRRAIVAAGGGAGIAAIFSAPIGGFIYAIEELLNSARPIVLMLVVITVFWADACADVLQAILKELGLNNQSFGGFNLRSGFQLEQISPLKEISFLPQDLSYLIILGIVIGILAELYCKYVLFMQKKGGEIFGDNLIMKMTISGVILGVIYSLIPGNIYPLNELTKLIAIKDINLSFALCIVIIGFLTSGLAAGSGAPGGLFLPMIILGGSIGLTCENIIEPITGYIPSTFIFAGMGAFVAACSRTPISSMFLVCALDKKLLMLKPVLIACLTSYLVANIFNQYSLYKRQMNKPKLQTQEVE